MNEAVVNPLPPYAPVNIATETYERAERIINISGLSPLARNTVVNPYWIDNSNTFWYRRERPEGHEFILVNAETKGKTQAFDHPRLAECLAIETGKSVSPNTLPLDDLSFQLSENNTVSQLCFNAFEYHWNFSLPDYQYTSTPLGLSVPSDELASPDGAMHIFRRNFNLWMRDQASGQERPLTTDGEKHNEYGWYSGDSQYYITAGLTSKPPLVVFSPDGKKLATERIDEREVGGYTLWQGAPEDNNRPKVHESRLSFAGDKHIPKHTLVIFDLKTGAREEIDQSLRHPDDIGSAVGKVLCDHLQWNPCSDSLYFLSTDRYFKTLRLSIYHTDKKTVSTLIEETSNTQTNVENSYTCVEWPVMKILANGEILWFSERSGYGHFYRYDKEGNLKNTLTQGNWSAYEIPFVDEERELAYILGAGRESGVHPYYRQLYQVPLDGSAIHCLTPEGADHADCDSFHSQDKGRFFASSGDYFVDNWSTSSTIPKSVLKASNGDVILDLETADISSLFSESGEVRWHHRPEVFQVKARDGKTEIYGEIFKPSHFDPDHKYPVIDDIYSTPYLLFPSWPSFTSRFWKKRQAYAELGFIVVVIHGLGTCGRSKAFQDYAYGNMEDGAIADHVTAIEQLAERHNYIDIDRVGIFGGSSGGYNVVLAMQKFPDFFKVGVSSVPGVDHPHLTGGLVERWQGPPSADRSNYDVLVLANKVEQLKGKLLLAFGDIDENVPMHTVVKFLRAMTQHNRDYDLIYLPNVDHWVSSHPYFVRRSWDYFVRHLMGSEPPGEYEICSPAGDIT